MSTTRLDKDEVLSGLDPVAYFAAHVPGFTGRQSGKYKDPFNPGKDKPFSLSLKDNTWVWKHHRNDIAGDLIDFVAEMKGLDTKVDFQEILAHLAEWSGQAGNNGTPLVETSAEAKSTYTPPSRDTVYQWAEALHGEDGRPLREKLTERGISDHVLRTMLIGFDRDRDVVTVPALDEKGDPLVARTWSSGGKLWSPKGSTAQLFGRHRLSEWAGGNRRLLVITEGEWDALVSMTAGLHAVCGTGGGGCWRDDWSEIIRGAGFTDVVIVPDHDDVGEKMTTKVNASLARIGIQPRIVQWPKDARTGYDLSDHVRKHGKEDLERLIASATAPKLRINTGDRFHLQVEQAHDAIARRPDLDIYRRGPLMVSVSESNRRPWLKDGSGTPSIMTVNKDFLTERLDRAADWFRIQKGLVVQDKPPMPTVRSVLATSGHARNLRELVDIVHGPVLLADGTVLDTPGYHPHGGLLYVPSPGLNWPGMPERLTCDEVEQAVEILYEPFVDFPVLTKADKSVLIAAVLTALARPAIDGPVPGTLITAPVRGSGKSLGADVVSMIQSGRPVPKMPPARNDEETRKRITTLVMAGSTLVCVDNISGAFGSDPMAAAMTATVWEDRILGVNEKITLPIGIQWILTGNNITLKGDLGRRVLVSQIDPKCEHPEDRTKFKHPNLLAWVCRNRGRLACAGLTILRAFHLHGLPAHGKPRKGSFEAWDDQVRAAMVWAKMPDPLGTQERIRAEGDEDLLRGRAGVFAVEMLAGSEGATAREMVEKARLPSFKEALTAIHEFTDCDDDKKLVRQLGYALRKANGQVKDGKRIVRAGENRVGTAVWKIEECR